MKKLKCESCGANLKIDENNEFAHCEYCGTKYKLKEDENSNLKIDSIVTEEFIKNTVNKIDKFENKFVKYFVYVFMVIFIAIFIFMLVEFFYNKYTFEKAFNEDRNTIIQTFEENRNEIIKQIYE